MVALEQLVEVMEEVKLQIQDRAALAVLAAVEDTV
jgi:hypothetical protein